MVEILSIYFWFAFLCILRQDEIPFPKHSTTEPTPTPGYIKNKHQLILTDIGEYWYVENCGIQNLQKKSMFK